MYFPLSQVPPQSDNFRQQLFETLPDDFFMFQREFYFYNSVLDRFKSLIEEEGEDGAILDFASGPLTLPGELTFNRGFEEPLVLENLSPAGYKMWDDEFGGLDLPHAIISLETIAKMHALGMVLLEKKTIDDENLVKLLQWDLTKLMNDSLLDMIDSGINTFIDWLAVHDEQDSKSKLAYLLKDRNYMTVLRDNVVKGKADKLQVILHGDAKTNNIMFKYGSDDTTPVGVALVDFQAMKRPI